MYIDSQLKFSDAQALTATAVSTNIVDLSVDRKIGIGEEMAVAIFVKVAADFNSTDETYNFVIQTDSDEGFSSPVDILGSGPLTGDLLGVGDIVVIPLGYSNDRYLRVNNILSGTTPSVTIDAVLMPMCDITGTVDYASGYTIT